jgi:hypothetical protein
LTEGERGLDSEYAYSSTHAELKQTHGFVSEFILHNESHPPPAILLDDAVEHMGKVDLRWQQLEVVGKPNTITQLIG